MKNAQYDNLRVAIRVRPPLNRETEEGIPFRSIAIVSEDHKSVSLAEYVGSELSELERQREWVENPNVFQLHRFTFDFVFDVDSQQEDVYNITAKQAVQSVLEGYNSTIFCYGQTGTGKTYTMEGFTYDSHDPQKGIIQRTIEDIFNYIETTSNENTKFIIRASFLQIYNENISDLLKPEKKNLQIREDKKKGIYVDSLSEWAVRSPIDLYALLKRGTNFRTTSSTNMNDVSSRSHAAFVITVEQMTTNIYNNDNIKNKNLDIKVGKLNLIDLAGSERIRITGATGLQLEESKKINKSLLCLGNVINALTEKNKRSKNNINSNVHIPYRDSKLTRLLQDSLGGNCKTTMIAMISPSQDSFVESLSTLHFAQRAKKIVNRPIINEDLNNRALIRQYENELKNLRDELEMKNKMMLSNELVMKLQEEKEQALQDKNEAIKELEKASRQYLIEREEKLKLEKKIQIMNSQMITGGHKIEETPQFKSALKNQLKFYEDKILEIEKERQKLEENKAENEEYKVLLFKQRDIMNALTYKLNERDEELAQLQEELEAFEKIDEINEKLKNRIELLEYILTENKIPFTLDNLNYNKNNKNYFSFKKKNNQSYLPYEVENNSKQYEGKPIIMLSADEKISELKNIINEQENKIHFLNLLSQKFINTVNQDGKIDINKLLQHMETNKDLYNKINDLQKQNDELKEKINEQNKNIFNLNEQINEKYDDFKLMEYKSNIITFLEEKIKDAKDNNVKNELFNIYKEIYQNTDNNFVQNIYNNNNKLNNVNINKNNSNSNNNYKVSNHNFINKEISIKQHLNEKGSFTTNNESEIENSYSIIKNNSYINNLKSMSKNNVNDISDNENLSGLKSIKDITYKNYLQKRNDSASKNNNNNNFYKTNFSNNSNNYNYNYTQNNFYSNNKINDIGLSTYSEKMNNYKNKSNNNLFNLNDDNDGIKNNFINNQFNNQNTDINFYNKSKSLLITNKDPRLRNKNYINKFINTNQ